MKKICTIFLCACTGLSLMLCTPENKTSPTDNLAKNFVTPPDDARIWVYWFWLNGNITREGITADLEAMKHVGIGGVLIMEVDQGAPVGPVDFMSDTWRELFKHMTSVASRLGIEVNMNNDAGWNGSGGPWIPLDRAMQVVTYSEQMVQAGTKFSGILPLPKTNGGFYRDIMVLAFPTPADPDMSPFMPVLTGRIVESEEVSERFLRDVRQTVSDLLAVNYIGRLRELANNDGLRLSMESYSTPANDLDVGNYIDEPISEFWTPDGGGFWWTQKAMSSLSHVNGLPITGAEAFTSGGEERWLLHPAAIKSLGDRAFCDGVNRFIIHRYAMQPWVEDRRPGMTMGPWGLHYERTQTWWEESKAWHEYVARCQYMLRQGTFIADVMSLNSEEPLQRFRVLTLNGYDYDGISPQKFLKDVTVQDGRLVLPSGMSYRLLVLPEDTGMSLAMLKKITALIEAGATVTGKAPAEAPGLTGYPDSDRMVKKMAEYLWGSGSETERKVGKGRVVTGKSPSEVLAGIGVKPDFVSNVPMNFIHRSVGGNEVYFIASQETETTDIVCSFRVTGMKPESWDAVTGRMQPITVCKESDGCTIIPMRLEPAGSRFIVFRKGAAKDSDRITSVKSEGKELVDMDLTEKMAESPANQVETRNTFTLAGWVKPEIEIVLPDEGNIGVNALSVERNDVVYAAPGHEVWTDHDAGAGFGAGTNGILVTEHAASYFPALLVHAVPVTGWTHVAVVYQDKTPSLWINGKFVRKGLRSSKIVHGGLGVAHTRRIKKFAGQVAGLEQFSKALDTDEIIRLFNTVPDTSVVVKVGPSIDLVGREIMKNGTYEIKTADGKTNSLLEEGIPEKLEIPGPWEVIFAPGMGAPDQVVLNKLISWTKHPHDGVKYFSGSAIYRKTFDLTIEPETENKLKKDVYLDLGRVAVIAQVKLNDKELGILWKPPYRVNITETVKNGENKLEIRIVNLMINRMIGDEFLPEDSERNENGTLKSWPQWLLDGKPSPAGRFTFTSWRLWAKDSPLQESGLLGPVSIQVNTAF